MSQTGANTPRYFWRRLVLEEEFGPASSTAILILLTLNHHMDQDGICWPSIELIARETRLNERTVRRNLKNMQEEGWIKIRKVRSRNGWLHNTYKLNFPRHLDIQHIAAQWGLEPFIFYDVDDFAIHF